MSKVLVMVVLALAACGGARTEPPSNAEGVAVKGEPTVAPPAAPSEKGASKVMVGTLRYSEAPATMSVEAYNHVSLKLEVDGGATEPLSSTDAVSFEALQALDGKRVEIEATWEEPQAPNPNEAYPIDPMTGEGQKRPGRWLVNKVHAI